MKPKNWFNIIQPTEIIINIRNLSGHTNFVFLKRPDINILSTKFIAAGLDKIARWNFTVDMIHFNLFHTVIQTFCLFSRKRFILSSDEPEWARKEWDVWNTNMNETCFLCEIFSYFGDYICSVSLNGYSVVWPVCLCVFWDNEGSEEHWTILRKKMRSGSCLPCLMAGTTNFYQELKEEFFSLSIEFPIFPAKC